MKYTIKLTLVVHPNDMNYKDQEEFDPCGKGDVIREVDIQAASEDEALDIFHNENPIAMLEHFSIDCEEA